MLRVAEVRAQYQLNGITNPYHSVAGLPETWRHHKKQQGLSRKGFWKRHCLGGSSISGKLAIGRQAGGEGLGVSKHTQAQIHRSTHFPVRHGR